MLYGPGVLNPTASLTGGKQLGIFLGGRATLLMLCLASILLRRPYVVWAYGMCAVEVGLSLVLAKIFWDQDGILLIDYLPKGPITNAEYYSSLLVQLKDI